MATFGEEDEFSEEEKALIAEAEELKEKIDEARQDVQDTDFFTMTENVEELGRVKLKIRRHLRGHLAKCTGVQWSSDGEHLLTAAQDNKMILWEPVTKNKVHMIPLESAWVMGCALSVAGDFIASGGLDDMICIFDLTSNEGPKLSRKMTGHEGYISCLRFLSDNRVLTSSGDKSCAIWDIETSKITEHFYGHETDVNAVEISKPNENVFVSASSDKTCRLWDIREAACVQIFEGHELDVNNITYFPQNEYAFATSSDDGCCRLWDIRADQPIAMYVDEYINCASTSVGISRSGRILIAGYDDYNLHIWDLLREERVGIMPAHDGRVSAVCVNKVGPAIATGSWDSTVIIWSP